MRSLTVDYTELGQPKEIRKDIFVAFCDSINCKLDIRRETSRNSYVRKNVSFSAVFCPDCGSALLWLKDQDRRHRNKVIPQEADHAQKMHGYY